MVFKTTLNTQASDKLLGILGGAVIDDFNVNGMHSAPGGDGRRDSVGRIEIACLRAIKGQRQWQIEIASANTLDGYSNRPLAFAGSGVIKRDFCILP